MATAEAQIVNLALQRVGETQFIDSLDEARASARGAKVAFPLVVQRLLECFPWRWAEGIGQLTALAGEDDVEWNFAYAMPANCAKPRRVLPWYAEPRAHEELEGLAFAEGVKADGGGKLLRCDGEDVWLVYTRNDIAVGLWPGDFVEAVAAALAVELALGVAKKPAVGLNFGTLAERALSVAKAADVNAKRRKPAGLPARAKVRL